ncbi:glutathione S-transferase [Coccomyxa subellipsoidea C-169]|uniref:Glutathione S-transferase n=1 Tax=Coccomyxa subellipsoidea (strain C-169) TaxID=574566 RepID=I0YIF3_COCSC|nr:glutathione S-transferase [Coccomyxa subellipsoidea C-169]EIE18172.1 glutathione S-transferase [Coccomyxa subellipsoidea C-169]|eukprot:XP_005642716.1 glutathione S-transferase [Coccomyxa subellipsoidea C-169]
MTTAAATPITFWDITPSPGGCPFAQRAWLTLEELGIPYEHKLADPANKPKEFTDLYASIVQNTDDSAKVPTIIDGDEKLTESLVVVEYLDAKYGGDTPIIPRDPAQLAKVKLFVELFSSKFQTPFFKILRAGSDDELAQLKQEFAHNLEVLDNFIKASGSEGGGYFLGERYSFAETVTTPFVRRALVTLPHFKGVDPLEIAKSKGLDRLVAWIQASMDRESNKKTGPSDEAIIESFKKFIT